jgi:signal peptidase I
MSPTTSLFRRIRSVVGPWLLILSIAAPLKSAVLDWNWVPTGSMAPSIVPAEMVLINKLAYGLRVPFTTSFAARWETPQRGDVVVLFSPVDGMRLVKRVIGLPGDVVEMRDEQLVLNGAPVGFVQSPEAEDLRDLVIATRAGVVADELLPGRRHAVLIQPGMPAPRSFAPLQVPEGHYFVLGDNRDDSQDSRYIGFIEERRIVGRVTTVLASFDIERFGLPRPDRFLSPIP